MVQFLGNMRHKIKWIAGLLLLGAASTAFLFYQFQKTDMLEAVHSNIKNQYPHVKHLSSADFQNLSNDDYVIIDVREADEFAVSHIDGAIRIDPSASADDVVDEIANIGRGKNIIFYCSVGVRSTILADKSRDKLQAMGAAGVYNLTGGIFKWHNEKRAMVDADGETPFVHPYDKVWGRLVERKDFIRDTP